MAIIYFLYYRTLWNNVVDAGSLEPLLQLPQPLVLVLHGPGYQLQHPGQIVVPEHQNGHGITRRIQ